MRMAVREAPRNWRMWQNLQYVSLDVDELQTAMLAVRRLVELDDEGLSSRHDLQRSVGTVVDVRVLGYVCRRVVVQFVDRYRMIHFAFFHVQQQCKRFGFESTESV